MRRLAPYLPAFLLLLAPTARAQPAQRWVVVAASVGATALDSDAVRGAEAALASSGQAVLPGDVAATRLESSLSLPFEPAPATAARRLGQGAESILEDVSFGRSQRALDTGTPLLAGLEQSLAALNRSDEVARDIANVCLFLARAQLQKRDLGAARQQVQVCLRLVPDLRPDATLHPTEVLELVTAARAALERGEGSVLAIQAAARDPVGCAVRVQGRLAGRSPSVRLPVPPGAYTVQIECGDRPGRLVSVSVLGSAPTRVLVQARLGSALETRPRVALQYPDEATMAGQLQPDVTALAEALELERVLVVERGRYRAFRAFPGGGAEETGRAEFAPSDTATSQRALEAAVGGASELSVPDARTAVLPAETPSGPPPPPSEPRAPAPREDIGAAVLGGAFVAVGVAGLGTSWYFYTEAEARGAAIRTSVSVRNPSMPNAVLAATAQRDFDQAVPVPLIVGGVGSAFVTIGLPLVLPRESGVPWWSVVIGVGGAALAGVGIWQATEPGVCFDAVGLPPCTRRFSGWILGTMLLEHAVPLLTVPLTYVVRALSGSPTATASARVDPSGVELGAGWTF